MSPRVPTPKQGRRPLLAAAASLSLAPGLPSEQNWAVGFRVCDGSVQIHVSVEGMRGPKDFRGSRVAGYADPEPYKPRGNRKSKPYKPNRPLK